MVNILNCIIYIYIMDHRLFVSPVKPPTEEQRKLTPSQWLEEGHHEAEVPTLEEVRKSLAYSMNEAEQLTRRAASNSKTIMMAVDVTT